MTAPCPWPDLDHEDVLGMWSNTPLYRICTHRFALTPEAQTAADDPATPIYGRLLQERPDTATLLHPLRFDFRADQLRLRVLLEERLAFQVRRPETFVSAWAGA